MKKIACKLIEFGFDFEYESRGSNGEKISVHEIDCIISTFQGEVFFEHEGEKEDYKDSEKTFSYLTRKVEKLIIKATSSF